MTHLSADAAPLRAPLFLLIAAISAEARAQDVSDTTRPLRHGDKSVSSGEPVYPAAFFAPFQPQTALDMLNRMPGFTVAEGSFVRGFGGAAGNVLIDGQRPTVKVGGISEVLRRIPASRVERILLLRGGEAAEAQGQALVANVILKADAHGSGTMTIGVARKNDGRLAPSGRASYARKLGDWQTSLELSGSTVRYPSAANYQLRDANGLLIQSRYERTDADAPEYGLAASASRSLLGGTLTLNARLGLDEYNSRQGILLYPGDTSRPSNGRRDIAYGEGGRFAELGTDWTRAVGKGWTLKLIGLGRVTRDTVDEDYAAPGLRGVSARVQKPTEIVARTTISREGNYALRPEIGGEIAWNSLSSHLDYAEDIGGGLLPVSLSGANTRVTELRGEGFANLNAKLSRTWSTELSMAVEFSQIRVTGDTLNSQSLFYPKPSAAIIWSPSGQTQLRLGLKRTVDQLDFGDFAASVDQANGRPIGGNAALRPARLTRALFRIDHRWRKSGAISAEFFHQWHNGMLGYIELESGDQAMGAIGTARQWGLTAQATLPLTALLSGALLKLDGTVRGSHVPDPITGRVRPIDSLPHGLLSAELRHDLPALRSAWGVRYEASEMLRTWYLSEEAYARTRPIWTAYIETTALAGVKAVLTVEGLTGQDSFRLRRFYQPTRAGAFHSVERRELMQGSAISLTLTHSL
jgi:hypothetical protein